MKCYERYLSVFRPNRDGLPEYVPVYEYVRTDDIRQYNYRKKIKFRETREAYAFFEKMGRKTDMVYQIEDEYVKENNWWK